MAAVAFAPKCTQNYKKGAKSRYSLNCINFSSAIDKTVPRLIQFAHEIPLISGIFQNIRPTRSYFFAFSLIVGFCLWVQL